MAGLKVVPVKTHADGNLDLEDLRAKAEKHKDKLAAFMVRNANIPLIPYSFGCRLRTPQPSASSSTVYRMYVNQQST